MRLTRRGRTVAGIVVVSFLWASAFGIQSLNAVVVPGIVALGAGYLLVRRGESVRVERHAVEPGFPDESRTVRIRVRVPQSLTASVEETLPPNLEPIGGTESMAVRGGEVRYEIRAPSRGIYRVGPATVTVSDPLGVIANRVETTADTSVVTYPVVRPLRGLDEADRALLEGAPTPDRHEFDQLREYRRGDSVRDIDWKSSAKRAATPLVVKEFVSERAAGSAVIAGSSEADGTDAMASAVASVAMHLLDAGVAVGIVTGDETVPIGTGTAHRREILTALARTEGGRVDVDRRRDAAITVEATRNEEVTVRFGGRPRRFDVIAGSATGRAIADGGWSDER